MGLEAFDFQAPDAIATANSMARPIFGLACAALLLCTLKAMCPSFVSAPRVPPALQPTAAVAEKALERISLAFSARSSKAKLSNSFSRGPFKGLKA